MSKMYKVNDKTIKTWNPFVGCEFNCCYCYARRIAQRSQCPKCKTFEPHWHPERIEKPPKFHDGETVFVSSMGDINFGITDSCFGQEQWSKRIMGRELSRLLIIILENPETTFMLQSKNPKCFNLDNGFGQSILFPDNLILGTTIETDKSTQVISQSPDPFTRGMEFTEINYSRKYITIEPILQFTPNLLYLIRKIKPEFIYIGYDNWNHHLNEPTLMETQELIKEIRRLGIEVREKTLRPAWYEK